MGNKGRKDPQVKFWAPSLCLAVVSKYCLGRCVRSSCHRATELLFCFLPHPHFVEIFLFLASPTIDWNQCLAHRPKSRHQARSCVTREGRKFGNTLALMALVSLLELARKRKIISWPAWGSPPPLGCLLAMY